MNQKRAKERATIASEFYTDWEERMGESWSRWHSIPMYVMVALRKTACEYCDVPITMGELRVSYPSVHLKCYGERLEYSMQLYKDIENKLKENELEQQNE